MATITPRILAALFAGSSIFSTVSCSTAPVKPMKNGGITHGQVQMNVVVGKTTQNDILESFGAPNITTIDGKNREVWTYQRHATIANTSSRHATAVILGMSSSGFESNWINRLN